MMNTRVKMLNRCVASLCKTRKLEKAEAVIMDGIVSGKLVDDVAAYNTLIDANCELGRFDVACDLVEEMKNAKISPDVATFSCLKGGATKRYLPEIYNSLKSGNPYQAYEIFQNILSGHDNSDGDEYSSSVSETFNTTIINGHHFLFRPYTNAITFNTVVKLLFRCNKQYHKRGLEFISTMRSKGFRLDGSAYCTVIRGLVKAGRMKEANVFKEQMMSDGNIRLDLICYNTLLHLYYKQGNFEAAIDVLEDIKKAGLEPDQYTHTIIFNALCKAGDIVGAIRYYLDCMLYEVGHLGLIDFLCEHGHIDMAMDLFEIIKDTAGSIAYTTMVHHLCKAGRFVCASKLIEAFIEDGITNIPEY